MRAVHAPVHRYMRYGCVQDLTAKLAQMAELHAAGKIRRNVGAGLAGDGFAHLSADLGALGEQIEEERQTALVIEAQPQGKLEKLVQTLLGELRTSKRAVQLHAQPRARVILLISLACLHVLHALRASMGVHRTRRCTNDVELTATHGMLNANR